MKSLDFGRFALSMGVAVAMFAGCGRSQPPIGAPGAMPQGLQPTNHRAHRTSGSSGQLVYVTTSRAVLMVSYPQGQIVGSLPWYSLNGIVCADPHSGNVFLPEDNAIYEYAHGETSPIATLSLPSKYSVGGGCSVDPTTGNLAIVGTTTIKGNSWYAVLIYPESQGSPTVYLDKKLQIFSYPAYDDSGNLFVTADTTRGAFRIGEIRTGQTEFTIIKLSENVGFPDKIQWDGTYLTFDYDNDSSGSVLDQVQISGRTATIVNSVQLHLASDTSTYFWLQGGSVFGYYQKRKPNNNQAIAIWSYPSGGSPTAKFYGMTKGRKDNLGDLTVSVAPSH